MSKNQDLCRVLFETAGNALLVLQNDQIIDGNASAASLLNYPLAELLGQSILSLLPATQPDGRSSAQVWQEAAAAASGVPGHYEWLCQRAPAETFYARFTLSTAEHRGQTYLQLGLVDIDSYKRAEQTFQKRMEEELKTQQAFLRQVLDAVPAVIFVKDWEGRFTLVNQTAADYYDTTIAQMIGKTDYDFGSDEAQVETFLAENRRIMRSQQPKFIPEEQTTGPDGEPRWHQLSIIPLTSDDGQSRQILGVAIDITDRKQLELQIQKLSERRERQVQTSTEVAQQAAMAPKLDSLFERVVNLMQERFGYYHVHIYTLEEDQLVMQRGTGQAGQKMREEDHAIPLAARQSLVARAARQGQPALAPDVSQEPGWLPNPLLPDTRSEIAVPIKLEENVLGVLDVQADTVGALDEEDQLLLAGLCGQIAVAIENTRLLEEAREDQAALQASEARNRALLNAIPDLIIHLKRDGTYLNVKSALDFESLGQPNDMIGKNMFDILPPKLAQQRRGYIEEAFKTGQNQLYEHELVREGEKHYEEIRVAPTDVDEVLILIRDITDRKREETEQERTKAELEMRVQELNALQQLMSREGWQTFSAARQEKSHGYLFDQTTVKPITASPDGNGQADLYSQAKAGNGHSLTAPVALQGEIIGQLGIYDDPDQPLTEEEKLFLDSVAEQIAEALERARLLEQTQKRAVELEAVAQVGTVASTTLEVDKLLQTVVDLTKRSFNLYHAHIYLLDPEKEMLVLRAGAGEVGQEMVSQGWSIPLDREGSLVARSVRTRQELIVNDVQREPGFLANPLLPDTRAELAVPLIAGERLLGVLDVQADTANYFTETDAQIHSTLATQVAVALENARLFEEEHEFAAKVENQARRLAQLNQMSAALNRAGNEEEIFEIAAQYTDQIAQSDRASIALLTADGNKITTIALRGEKGAITVGTELPLAGTAIGLAIDKQELVNFADIRDSHFTEHRALIKQGLRSVLVAPLVVQDQIIGTLNVGNKELNAFEANDENLMRQLAALLSSALENRRLFAQTQAALQEVEATQRRYTVQAWETYRAKTTSLGYEQARDGSTSLGDPLPAEVKRAMAQRKTIAATSSNSQPVAGGEEGHQLETKPDGASSSLITPLAVRGEVIGVMGLQETDAPRQWSPEEISLVEAIAEEIAQTAENLRLLDETQRRAAREQQVNQIGEKIRAAQSLEEALQIAVKEVGVSLKAAQTSVLLQTE